MYPADYFHLFPAFPLENQVFVAMSFSETHERRWTEVIAPAISAIQVNGSPLAPYRVDARQVSDSILTEILDGISRSQLVLADITTIGLLGHTAVRNGNVFYEVGLAHAIRLPEEVLLFRSDSSPLLFDVANVRVNYYDPDNNPEKAIEIIHNAIIDARKEIDQKRILAVRRAADTLDNTSLMVLLNAAVGSIAPNQLRTMGDILSGTLREIAISRLLELGLLATQYTEFSPEAFAEILSKESEHSRLLNFQITPFGRAVVSHIRNRWQVNTPEIRSCRTACAQHRDHPQN